MAFSRDIYYLLGGIAVLAAIKSIIKDSGVDEAALPDDDRLLRESLSEGQIDKMVNDSFPASDPPSTY